MPSYRAYVIRFVLFILRSIVLGSIKLKFSSEFLRVAYLNMGNLNQLRSWKSVFWNLLRFLMKHSPNLFVGFILASP